MPWWPSWSKRRKAAAMRTAACPAWAAWATWICSSWKFFWSWKKAPSGAFFFCITLLRMRILVAEDDAILADGVTRTLRQSGYAVDWVKNGAEADNALDSDDFDLLIL